MVHKKMEHLHAYVDRYADDLYRVALKDPLTESVTVVCSTINRRTANRIAALIGRYGL